MDYTIKILFIQHILWWKPLNALLAEKTGKHILMSLSILDGPRRSSYRLKVTLSAYVLVCIQLLSHFETLCHKNKTKLVHFCKSYLWEVWSARIISTKPCEKYESFQSDISGLAAAVDSERNKILVQLYEWYSDDVTANLKALFFHASPFAVLKNRKLQGESHSNQKEVECRGGIRIKVLPALLNNYMYLVSISKILCSSMSWTNLAFIWASLVRSWANFGLFSKIQLTLKIEIMLIH